MKVDVNQGSQNKIQGAVQKIYLKQSDSERLKIKGWPNYTRQMFPERAGGGNPGIR